MQTFNGESDASRRIGDAIKAENGMTFKLDLRENSRQYVAASNRQARTLPICVNSYGYFNAGPEHFTDRKRYMNLYQVFWTRSGMGRFLLDGREFIARENTVALMDFSRPHRYEAMGDGWEHEWVNFVGSACSTYWDLINPEGFRVYPLDGDREIPQLMHGIRDGMANKDMPGLVRLSTNAVELLDAIYALTVRQHRTADKRGGVLDSARYIEAHYMERLSLDDMAQAAFLSKFYYNRAFKRCIGMTPAEYLNAVRIGHAKEMLLASELSVEEIGWRVGFGGSKNFIRQFRQSVGETPGAYRRRFGG